MNKIIIHGNLTRNIELKQTNSGKAVCNVNVAVKRKYNPEEVDFIDGQAWEKKAEFLAKYFSKGQEIVLSGELQSRKWEDKDGKNRTNWFIAIDDVDFCGKAKDKVKSDTVQNADDNNYGIPIDGFNPIDDDDLPF